MGMKYRLCGDVVLWIRCGKVESLFVMFLNIYSRYFFRERVFYILKGKIEIFFFFVSFVLFVDFFEYAEMNFNMRNIQNKYIQYVRVY